MRTAIRKISISFYFKNVVQSCFDGAKVGLCGHTAKEIEVFMLFLYHLLIWVKRGFLAGAPKASGGDKIKRGHVSVSPLDYFSFCEVGCPC